MLHSLLIIPLTRFSFISSLLFSFVVLVEMAHSDRILRYRGLSRERWIAAHIDEDRERLKYFEIYNLRTRTRRNYDAKTDRSPPLIARLPWLPSHSSSEDEDEAAIRWHQGMVYLLKEVSKYSDWAFLNPSPSWSNRLFLKVLVCTSGRTSHQYLSRRKIDRRLRGRTE